MPKVSKKDAIKTLNKFIKQKKGASSNWCCGITNNPRRRIINQHKVNEARGTYGWVECNSKNCAEIVEKKMLKKGYAGNTGGGNDESVYVYVYKKTPKTKP